MSEIKCQQYELYKAEQSVPLGLQFADISDIQRYVDQLRERPWWALEYANVLKVEVLTASGKASVGGFFPEDGIGRMRMARVHFNELIVLHELAHVLAAARHNSQAHCPYFARVYLELVSRQMGPESYQALHQAFEQHNITHDPQDQRNKLARFVLP